MEGERSLPGNPLGVHRVLDEKVCLPQAAERLDNTLPIYSNEILLEVERLNIDAASFVQMEKENGKDPKALTRILFENTRTRGKQHNRVTGSGGMLIGRVSQVGSKYRGRLKAKVGDRIASLVSLTLTPLHLEKIVQIDFSTHQIEVKGHAILFESSIAAHLPSDLPDVVSMAVYDVAGAPTWVHALCKPGNTVIIVGAGGKAGVLCCVAAKRKVGARGKVIAIEPGQNAARDLDSLKVCHQVLSIDATDPIAVKAGVERATRGKMGDIVVNVASVGKTEVGTLLSACDRGKVLFFSMATSFTQVVLGAEGIACRATLYFGNGYYPNHSKFALDLLRRHRPLKELFFRRYTVR
jgi:L-erythro-3,5-diaminohexanoate dehydrogenase